MKQFEQELVQAGFLVDEPQGLSPEENLILSLLSIPRKIGKHIMGHIANPSTCINCGRMGETSASSTPPVKVLERFIEKNSKVSKILKARTTRTRGRVVKGMVIRNGFCGRCVKQLKSKIPNYLKEKERGASTSNQDEDVAMRPRRIWEVLPQVRRGGKEKGNPPGKSRKDPGDHNDSGHGDENKEKEEEKEEKITST